MTADKVKLLALFRRLTEADQARLIAVFERLADGSIDIDLAHAFIRSLGLRLRDQVH